MADAATEAVWKILVVDDEPAIHQVTKLALRNFSVEGRSSQLISAMSSADAKEQLERHPDIAVILLDVVMESERAGLDLVKHIREVAKNSLVRIILRTGQPGQAPERSVMVEYDINDYKEKTELTAAKLFTAVMSSVRNFKQIYAIGHNRAGLEAMGHLNREMFAAPDKAALAECLLRHFMQLELFKSGTLWWGSPQGPAAAQQGEAGPPPESVIARFAEAQAAPGIALAAEGYQLLALPHAQAPCLLSLQEKTALSEAELYVLNLLADSAGAALTRCSL
ncbi:response regulator [Paucibacter sp. KBW04]|uniref:response regulator n=1 Tax=Paucibacter sp. KBW04 TaxID=2153361 RepID=UPI0018CC304C|nr:response regulator [Paucibacter sp. KBW04]